MTYCLLASYVTTCAELSNDALSNLVLIKEEKEGEEEEEEEGEVDKLGKE